MTCALAKKDLERRSLRMVGLLNGATGLSKSQLGSTGATPIGRRVAIALIVSSSDNQPKRLVHSSIGQIKSINL